MRVQDLFWLIALAAIWGASFVFMKVASPVLGAAYLAEGRTLFAAIFLSYLAFFLRKNTVLLGHWRHYVQIGFFNSALPFVCLGYAAATLTMSQIAILNSTAPLWGFVIGLLLKNERFKLSRGVGLLLGVIGVLVLVGGDKSFANPSTHLPIIASLISAFSYGVASNLARKQTSIEPFDHAHGSMWAASVLLIPVLFFIPMKGEPTSITISALVAIGVLCSGIAYLIYFRLIKNAGPTSALAVIFLIPAFTALYGMVLFDEPISLSAIVGMGIILLGTLLVTGSIFRSDNLLDSKEC